MRKRHTLGQRDKLWTSKVNGIYSAAEPLERRVLLSISAASIAGVYTQPGTQWTYNTADSEGDTSSFSYKVSGPTTFQGQNAYSLGFTGSDGSTDSSYLGFDSSGNFVIYGSELSNANVTDTEVETPSQIVLPASMTAGVPFTTSYQDVNTNASTDNGTTTETDDDSETITLQSETPSPVTVPAGTFNCYAITITSTDLDETDAGSTPTTDTETIDMAPGVGFVSSSDTDTSSGDDGAFTGELASFQGVQDHLVFTKQPTDTSIDDTIAPVTVSVDDSQGNLDANNGDSITLNLITTKGDGALAGTVTATAVNGVATFSDLSIDSGGQYMLQATDNAATSPAAGATSASFNVSDGQLVFLSSPKSGFAGEALTPPIKVELQDKNGKVITDSKATTVTLAPTGDQSDAPITGQTAPLKRGIAKFTDVQLDTAGTYTLSANDDQSDTEGDSTPFKVAGDALKVITKVSAANAGDLLKYTFSVQQVTHKGKPVLTDNSTEVTLSAVGTAPDNLITGDTTVTMVNGRATFSGLTFNVPGTYVLQATDDSDDEPATFGKIKVEGFNIKFLHLQDHANASLPFAYEAYIENEQGRVDTDFTGNVSVSLNVLPSRLGTTADHNGAQLVGTTTVALTEGRAQFTLLDGDAITDPGTYSLTATAQDTGAVPASAVTPGTSRPILVDPLKLTISVQPSRVVDVNQEIDFQVQLRTDEDTVLSPPLDGEPIGVEVSSATSQGQNTTAFSSSLVQWNPTTFTADISNLKITAPGTYVLTISAIVDFGGIEGVHLDDAVTPVTIGPITVVVAGS